MVRLVSYATYALECWACGAGNFMSNDTCDFEPEEGLPSCKYRRDSAYVVVRTCLEQLLGNFREGCGARLGYRYGDGGWVASDSFPFFPFWPRYYGWG